MKKPSGLDLIPVLVEMANWSAEHDPQTGAPAAWITPQITFAIGIPLSLSMALVAFFLLKNPRQAASVSSLHYCVDSGCQWSLCTNRV